MQFEKKASYTIEDLLAIMQLLRAPDGCPWDRQQTHLSIRSNFLEETCEVLEAIDNRDAALLKEELGDVLLQIVFHAQIEREKGGFAFDDVCDGICKKLIVRHPHIFADIVANTPDEVLHNWEEIKKREKGQTTQTETLKSVPRTLPALMRSEKVQKRAARTGFDYPDVSGALRDLCSEVEELTEAIENGKHSAIEEELGDVLFSVANVARFVQVDSEQALGASCDKFIERFEKVEQIALSRKIDMRQADLAQLDQFWQEAKIKDQ